MNPPKGIQLSLWYIKNSSTTTRKSQESFQLSMIWNFRVIHFVKTKLKILKVTTKQPFSILLQISLPAINWCVQKHVIWIKMNNLTKVKGHFGSEWLCWFRCYKWSCVVFTSWNTTRLRLHRTRNNGKGVLGHQLLCYRYESYNMNWLRMMDIRHIEVTLEMGCEKTVHSQQTMAIYGQNKQSLFDFLERFAILSLQ